MSDGRLRLALAGDTMLGRGVAAAIQRRGSGSLFSRDVVAVAHEADLFVLNLECCISERGERWPDPDKPFFFRAPPAAVETLVELGVDGVTLANNHALDYGPVALVDTLDHLAGAGIGVAGAGRDREEARGPLVLEHRGVRVRIVAVTDHPSDYAAGDGDPGVAFAELRRGVPAWVAESLSAATDEVVVVTPHWGPNMTTRPVAHVEEVAGELTGLGAALVAGHSAHVFHAVSGRVLYDMGDFIDDYAVDPRLRNDLGLLFLVDVAPRGPVRLEAVPLALDFCFTRLAVDDEWEWIRRRFSSACAAFGTDVHVSDGRLVIEWPDG